MIQNMNVSQYRGLFLQANLGAPPLRESPVADFWTQIGSNIGELIKTFFEYKLSDSSTDKSAFLQSRHNNGISGSSLNKNFGENVRPNNDDQIHFVAENSDDSPMFTSKNLLSLLTLK